MSEEYSAGTTSKGDCQVIYRPGREALSIEITSSTGGLFRRAIAEAARREAAEFFGPSPTSSPSSFAAIRPPIDSKTGTSPGGLLILRDEGALDYVIGARVETALRAAGLNRKEQKPLPSPAANPGARRRLRRSRLYIPGNQPDLHANAGLFGADCLLLDLEDSVEAGRKTEARLLVARLLALHRDFLGSSEVAVRVNPLESPWGPDDLVALVAWGPDALVLPKCESADQLRAWDEEVGRLERGHGLQSGRILFMPLVETARGVARAQEIASASPRNVALCFGAEDFRADLGLPRAAEEEELTVARSLLVIAARAAGLEALDSVYAGIEDEVGLAASAARARALGFSGKGLVHPCQIETVHRAFSPTKEEEAWARDVVRILEEAAREGRGAASLDGLMIDAPLLARARSILAATGEYHGN